MAHVLNYAKPAKSPGPRWLAITLLVAFVIFAAALLVYIFGFNMLIKC